MSSIELPNAKDRQRFMSAIEVYATKTFQELGHDRVAEEVKNVDVDAATSIANLCFRDRTAMRMFTFMVNNGDQGFKTSACAAALSISEDVAETYLQVFADAGLISR